MSWETSRQIIPIPKATTAMTTLNWLWWLQTWIVIYSFMASSITFVNILTRFWLPSFWRKYSRKCTTIFLKTENNHLACLISIFFLGHRQFPQKFLRIIHSIFQPLSFLNLTSYVLPKWLLLFLTSMHLYCTWLKQGQCFPSRCASLWQWEPILVHHAWVNHKFAWDFHMQFRILFPD